MASRRVKTMNPRTSGPESGRRSCSCGSHRRSSRSVVCAIAVALAAIAGGAVPGFAGGLVIEAPNLTVAAGSSGSFDLLLVNTNPIGGTSYEVSSDQFVLFAVGAGWASHSRVSRSTRSAAPYIFVTSGTTLPGGPPLSADTFPNTSFTADRRRVRAAWVTERWIRATPSDSLTCPIRSVARLRLART